MPPYQRNAASSLLAALRAERISRADIERESGAVLPFFAVTTNTSELKDKPALEGASAGNFADQCRKAWRIFGHLVFSGYIHVGFADPD